MPAPSACRRACARPRFGLYYHTLLRWTHRRFRPEAKKKAEGILEKSRMQALHHLEKAPLAALRSSCLRSLQ